MADITIGNAAIDRDSSAAAFTHTIVDRVNPASANGTITSIELYSATDFSDDVTVSTFFVVSGNNLSTRASQVIGAVGIGYHQFDVSLAVVAGDYIGISCNGYDGYLEAESETSVGYWELSNIFPPIVNETFDIVINKTLSLYGTGVIIPTYNYFGYNSS